MYTFCPPPQWPANPAHLVHLHIRLFGQGDPELVAGIVALRPMSRTRVAIAIGRQLLIHGHIVRRRHCKNRTVYVPSPLTMNMLVMALGS